MRGRPCDEGRCLDGYTCDPATNTCVTAGDACTTDAGTGGCLDALQRWSCVDGHLAIDSCDDVNPCTQDACSAGACENLVGNAGVTCRDANGPCDLIESCSGVSATCPADQLAPAGTPCRGTPSACDAVEICTGSSATCPADGPIADDGTPCGPASTCAGSSMTFPTCDAGQCTGSASLDCAATSGCVIVLSGPPSTPVGQPATLLLEACPGLGAQITCTTSGARYALFTQDFAAGLGGFSGTGVSTGVCNMTGASVVPAGATASDDCSGAIMVIAQTRTARAQPNLSGVGMTGLRVNLKVGMSTDADGGEVLGVRACCGDPATTCAGPLQVGQQVGAALGADDGGKDGWGARPCLSGTCSGAGYALGGSFDGCSQMALELVWNASGGPAGNELVLVDDVVVSGVGTPVLPLTDNGDGTYNLSVIPYEPGPVTVTCMWGSAAGTPTDSWTMTVSN
ncbi:MAG: hypothetical protein ACAI38_19105 [Myxococcota bacterium]|nr:hypothetical protein [Myxococcota bacterium]